MWVSFLRFLTFLVHFLYNRNRIWISSIFFLLKEWSTRELGKFASANCGKQTVSLWWKIVHKIPKAILVFLSFCIKCEVIKSKDLFYISLFSSAPAIVDSCFTLQFSWLFFFNFQHILGDLISKLSIVISVHCFHYWKSVPLNAPGNWQLSKFSHIILESWHI